MASDKRQPVALVAGAAVADLFLCFAIIYLVPYTEIDWRAYMQEVEGYQAGQLDYTKLQGDTGPLVYPAGFVYVYSALRSLTDNGTNILSAQIIFAFLSAINTGLVLSIFRRLDLPLWAWAAACLSRRIHSIFVLRLFNDAIAMMLLYCAILLFLNNRWRVGSAFFSFAVSIKMNVLLFAPSLLLLFLQTHTTAGVLLNLSVCGAIQIVLGAPFLLAFPFEYISRAFEFGRVFIFKWTVNWKMVDPEFFISKKFAFGLLFLHLLFLFWVLYVLHKRHPLVALSSSSFNLNPVARLPDKHIALTLFLGNFIGVVFARSLHYQFYVWYFHSLPLLVVFAEIPVFLGVCLLFGIEFIWNIFPATATTSSFLLFFHFFLLFSLIRSLYPDKPKTK